MPTPIPPSHRDVNFIAAQSTSSSQGLGKVAQEELDKLSAKKEEFFKLFRKVFVDAEADKLNSLDFLKLESLLGDFEAQATHTREAIQALAGQDATQAGALKKQYDEELGDLSKSMSDLGESVITERKAELDQQTKDLLSRTDIIPSPGEILKLKNDYKQLGILIEEFRDEMRRVQFQRLFELK